MDRRLVDHLVNSSLVSRATLQRHILRASRNKTSVGEELVDAGDLSEDQLASAVAHCYGYETLDLSTFTADPRALKMLSANTADKKGILPIALNTSSDQLTVVLHDVESTHDVLDTLKMATGTPPVVKVGPRGFVNKAIRHFYFGEAWPERPMPSAMSAVEEISDEFVLEDPVVEEPKRDRRPTIPPPTPAPLASAPPRRVTPDPPKKADVAQALEDFDAFLDQADIRPPSSTPSPAENVWGDLGSGFGNSFDIEPPPNNSSLGSPGKGSVFGDFEEPSEAPAADGFDLFEPSEAQMTLQELVEEQATHSASSAGTRRPAGRPRVVGGHARRRTCAESQRTHEDGEVSASVVLVGVLSAGLKRSTLLRAVHPSSAYPWATRSLVQPSIPVSADFGPERIRATLLGFDRLDHACVIKQERADVALSDFERPSVLPFIKVVLAKPRDVFAKVGRNTLLLGLVKEDKSRLAATSPAQGALEPKLAHGAGSRVKRDVLCTPDLSPNEVTCS
ncbi:MAG: hypothetical protein R3E66_09790 [bacterium]